MVDKLVETADSTLAKAMKQYPFKLDDQVIVIDVNCINVSDKSPYAKELDELERLNGQGKVTIMKTDMLDAEMKRGDGYPPGLSKSAGYIECEGVAVVGFSRAGHAVVGTDNDRKKIKKILVLIFGSKQNYSPQEVSDAMHIHTAGRYGAKYFVTRDKKLLNKTAEIRSLVGGLFVCDPKTCLDAVKKAYARWDKLIADRDNLLKDRGLLTHRSPKQ